MKMTDLHGSTGTESPQADMALSHYQLSLLCADLRHQNALLTARVRQLEDEICRDTLTPLFNRRYFEQAVAGSIAHCQRYQSRAVLLFLDVDDLKGINDTFGHAAGDEALRTIAHVLTANVRSTDVVARIGGDEFAVLLEALPDPALPERLAARIVAALAEPVRHAGLTLQLGASVGIARQAGCEPAELFARADGALYAAKAAARNTFRSFDHQADPAPGARRVPRAALVRL